MILNVCEFYLCLNPCERTVKIVEKQLCDERHQRIGEKFEIHERRINNHSERLDRVELTSGRFEERLDSLIHQLAALNSTMKWFMGIMIGAFISFFFYAVQQGVL